jgi:hypothetical protein
VEFYYEVFMVKHPVYKGHGRYDVEEGGHSDRFAPILSRERPDYERNTKMCGQETPNRLVEVEAEADFVGDI